mmetsp:Transcript_14141/g.24020  ORF Transcript_14141/g.24020 Transcript_14141/m.24020 type:complete len:83 (-) Transcript_14141:821-1069(-)
MEVKDSFFELFDGELYRQYVSEGKGYCPHEAASDESFEHLHSLVGFKDPLLHDLDFKVPQGRQELNAAKVSAGPLAPTSLIS